MTDQRDPETAARAAAEAQAAERALAEARDKVAERQKLASDRLFARRTSATEKLDPESCIKLGDDWHDLSGDVLKHYCERPLRTGIAFSGGGIRSATISLGLAEAFAARGRFYGFDLMSTVSGGGYCGSFLRSLFVEREEGAGKRENFAIVPDRPAFAEATLTSLPDQQYFRGKPGHSAFVADKQAVKNPLWWLRENGRYLAPGGMSDYGYALAYIVRNWLTLITYVLAVMILAFAALQVVLAGFVKLISGFGTWLEATVEHYPAFSPTLPPVGLLAVVGGGIAAGYWLTLSLAYGRPTPGQQSQPGRVGVYVGVGVVLALLLLIAVLWLGGWLPHDTTARG